MAISLNSFGMMIEERSWSIEAYRYGFNGMEIDDETKGKGNSLDFGARIYDSRLGRWLSVDPLSKDYPSQGSYNFVCNLPISCIDPDGRKTIFVNGYYNTRKKFIAGWIVRNYVGSQKGRKYWGSSFISEGQKFLGDVGNNTQFVDGRGAATSKADERYKAGYEFAKANYENLTSDLKKDKDGNIIESINMVTHSHGSAYGEGMIKLLEEKGIKVKTVVHLSAKQPGSIKASEKPTTYQLGYGGDPVVDEETAIEGVDKFGKVDGGTYWDMLGNHAKTKYDAKVWDAVEDLSTAHVTSSPGLVTGNENTDNTSVTIPPSKSVGGNKNGTIFLQLKTKNASYGMGE